MDAPETGTAVMPSAPKVVTVAVILHVAVTCRPSRHESQHKSQLHEEYAHILPPAAQSMVTHMRQLFRRQTPQNRHTSVQRACLCSRLCYRSFMWLTTPRLVVFVTAPVQAMLICGAQRTRRAAVVSGVRLSTVQVVKERLWLPFDKQGLLGHSCTHCAH